MFQRSGGKSREPAGGELENAVDLHGQNDKGCYDSAHGHKSAPVGLQCDVSIPNCRHLHRQWPPPSLLVNCACLILDACWKTYKDVDIESSVSSTHDDVAGCSELLSVV